MKLLDIYRDRLRTSSDSIALVSELDSLTFADVDRRSDFVASIIRDCSGASVIPFYLKHTINVLPVVIGILKAGATPLPLTNALPIEKAIGKVDEMKVDVVLTDECMPAPLGSVNVISITHCFQERQFSENARNIRACGDTSTAFYECQFSENIRNVRACGDTSAAYIICTSGTTGKPKKVFITEDNLVRILSAFYRLAGFTHDSRFLFTTPYTFDVSLTEIFAPVFCGGVLVCCDMDNASMRDIDQLIEQHAITHLSLSPSFAEFVFETCGIRSFSRLKFLGIAGEEFPTSLANNLIPAVRQGCKVFNLYGPSETTIYATFYELTPQNYDHVPIGRPLEGVEVRVVPDDRSVKADVGELYIGGCGVTKGYLLQPELNAEKFEYREGRRFYKTGDYAHYDDKGFLVFDGRRDTQVQINGIRVELDEVKSNVLSVKGVRAVRVAYYEGRIYVFYESNADCKEAMLSELPNYLKPIIVRVDGFILNQNRKLDIPAMVKRYYGTKDDRQTERITETIGQLLKGYGVKELTELDSLDTIRFFLDVEQLFNITISSKALSSLRCIDDIGRYVNELRVKSGDDACKLLRQDDGSFRGAKELDALTIGVGVSDYAHMSVNEFISSTCTQKWFFDRDIRKFTCIEIPLSTGTSDELLKAKEVISVLAQSIDILRMVAVRCFEDFRFGLIDKESFVPRIYVLAESDVASLLEEILPEHEFFPVPLITYSPKDRTLRFHFSYHAIDARSLHMLSQILYKAIRDSHCTCNKSSFRDFRRYIEAANENVNCNDLLHYMPQGELLTFDTLGDRVQVISVTRSDGQEPTQEDTLYCIFRALIEEREITLVTGALSYNLRTFDNFDAQDIIGDVHTKIPFFLKMGEDLDGFLTRFNSCLNVYRKGIDLRWLATRKMHTRGAEILGSRWDTLNFSVNYLGIAMDSHDMLSSIKEIDFDRNFMNMFTCNNSMMCVIGEQIFKNKSYTVPSDDVTYCLQTRIG